MPITTKRGKKSSKDLLKKTIKRGFVLSPEVVYNYKDYDKIISLVEKELGLTSEKLNSSFHKSWTKIKNASDEQLLIEQIIHYVTTYGFEEMGIHDSNSIYIPKEKLEIPELKDDINLTIIKGYTKKELKEKLLNLLSSGIALKDDTMNDIMEVIKFVGFNSCDIDSIRNKEIKIMLYDKLDMIPEEPVEFLRYIVVKLTGDTLLIKNKELIEKIKLSDKKVKSYFNSYKKEYGLEKLSEIFYRFKPLFLAMKSKDELRPIINKLRRYAIAHHKPLKADLLNSITALLKNNKDINFTELNNELNKVNTFRKIRLVYALKFRMTESDSILYKVRNGKSYAKSFSFQNSPKVKKVFDIVLSSITSDVAKNINKKKIYLPKNMVYSLSATEKQFTGYFPSGSYVDIDKDMIFGVYWENVNNSRIDLDLSLISNDGKIGWDRSFRNDDRSIMFSGDMTDASGGASELFYVKKQLICSSIVMLNYYNAASDSIDVPFKIITAREEAKDFKQNYMVNPNNVVAIAKSKISPKNKQKILGLLVATTNGCRFYFCETAIGKSITSGENKYTQQSRDYLFNYHRNTIDLYDVLCKAGARFVDDKKDCDIDLSAENLEKDTIINLIK